MRTTTETRWHSPPLAVRHLNVVRGPMQLVRIQRWIDEPIVAFGSSRVSELELEGMGVIELSWIDLGLRATNAK